MNRELRRQVKRVAATRRRFDGLFAQGDFGPALETNYELVELCRSLAADADWYLEDLARALGWRGRTLAALERHGDALIAFEEAIATARRSHGVSAQAVLSDLLMSQSATLRRLERGEDAVHALEEALAILQTLTDSGELAVEGRTAEALVELHRTLRFLGRHEEALLHLDRAIAILREITPDGPRRLILDGPRIRFELASALGVRCEALSLMGRHEEALAAIEEAVAIHGQLEDERVDPYLAIAAAWCQLADALNALGRQEDALDVTEAALRRSLFVIEWADDFWPWEAVALVEECTRRLQRAGREIDAGTMRRVREVRTGSGPPPRGFISVRRIGDR